MNKIALLSITILAISCGGSVEHKDIPISVQDSILMKITEDIHVAEVASRVYDDNNRDSVYQALKDEIFFIHEMDSSTYQIEMDSLTKDPGRYLLFYKNLTERMDSTNKLRRNRD